MCGAVFIDEFFAVVRVSERSYHRSANDQEFFRRHALIEAKLKSLDLPVPIDEEWLRTEPTLSMVASR